MAVAAIEKARPSIKAEAIREADQASTFRAFIANNPELQDPTTKQADPVKLKAVEQVFKDIPVLNQSKTALVDAKEIALSEGETTLEKYDNWKKGKINGEPSPAVVPAAPQLGAAGGAKPIPAGSAKKDMFSTWIDGLDI